MKVMHSEWSGRIRHWIRTLKDDFYEPLGEFRWEGHRTMEHISPEQALGLTFEQVQPGFTWGNTYEYCWFRSRIELPGRCNLFAYLQIWVSSQSRYFVLVPQLQ